MKLDSKLLNYTDFKKIYESEETSEDINEFLGFGGKDTIPGERYAKAKAEFLRRKENVALNKKNKTELLLSIAIKIIKMSGDPGKNLKEYEEAHKLAKEPSTKIEDLEKFMKEKNVTV